MALFERIKVMAKEKNITIAQLERECGFCNSYIRKWQKVTPGIDKLQKVADVLGVGVDVLLGSENIKYEPNTHTWNSTKEEPIEERTDGYYVYEQTREITDFLMHNPEYSVLFDASRKVKPEDIEKAIKILGILSED